MKNFVFLGTSYGMMDGHPMNLNTPTHKFREILDMYNARCETENEKLPIIRLQDLRHTTATLLLSQNVDIETVANRLGHSRASVTLDIYGHAMKEMDRKASEALARMIPQEKDRFRLIGSE